MATLSQEEQEIASVVEPPERTDDTSKPSLYRMYGHRGDHY